METTLEPADEFMLDRPEQVLQEWTNAWNAGDAQRLALLFDEDAEFVNVVGLWWHHRDDIEKAHAYGFQKIFTGSTIEMFDERVRRFGETAVVQSRWKIRGQIAHDGVQAQERTGVFTFVMLHRTSQTGQDRWVCVAAQNTDIIPGVETHINTGHETKPVDYRTE